VAVKVEDTTSFDAHWHHQRYHWRPYCQRSTYGHLDLDEALTGGPINMMPYRVMLAWT